jgi:nitroreductase
MLDSRVMSNTLDLSPDELLTTTRAVRKRLDFDRPVPRELVEECVQIALQAPSGSNARGWHFVVVGDEKKRKQIGDLYRQAFDGYRDMPFSAHKLAEDAVAGDVVTMNAVVSSAEALAANLHRAPYLVIPCLEGRMPPMPGPMGQLASASQFGSVLPAFWSFMLAARARGLGTSWTTLHLLHEEEIAGILGIPFETVMQTALSPLAYTIGTDFKPAKNRDVDSALHVDSW